MSIINLVKTIKRTSVLTYRSCKYPYSDYMDKYRCVFIHIPKAGGSSIRHALGAEPRGRLHLPWSIYYQANPIKFKSYYKFAFVRHPVDRVFSAYNYLSSGGNQIEDLDISINLLRYKSFDEFILRGLREGDFSNHPFFFPQTSYICDWDGSFKVDFCGKIENFDLGVKVVLNRLGLSVDIPHRNKSKSIKILEPGLSPEALDYLKTLYFNDFKWLGYV